MRVAVEVKNQARVHLWYRRRFQADYPQLTRTTDGIDRYPIACTCVGIDTRSHALYAPNGLVELQHGILGMNPRFAQPAMFRDKGRNYQEGALAVAEHRLTIDHLFMFIEPGGPEIEALKRLGLQEIYRCAHPGQGPANVCFGFDNLYPELLWLTSEAEARSDPIARTRLWERSQWRTLGTCPFGIGFRGDPAGAGVSVWDYRPPYLDHVLPPVPAIQVAADSDDPMQPMLFSFPGSTAPRNWATERQGRLQHAAGWTEARGLKLNMPPPAIPCAALTRLAGAAGFVIERSDHPAYGVALRLARQNAPGDDIMVPPLSGR